MKYNIYMLSLVLAMLWFCLSIGYCQDADVTPSAPIDPSISTIGPGDRVTTSITQPAGLAVTSLSKDSYRLGPGDVLSINVQGRSAIGYPSTTISVAPTGGVYLHLIGNVEVIGKTVLEVETEISERLAKYLKHFTVNVELSRPRAMYIWAFGEVGNPGLRVLPAVATASLAALSTGVKPSGTVRCIEFTRGEKKMTLDLYRVMVLGDIESDFDVLPGDKMYVPLVKKYVSIGGEVFRGGRYEMVAFLGGSEIFRIRDLLELAIGTTPASALDKAYVERIGSDGKIVAIKIDLSNKANSTDADMQMQTGDNLVIPSIASFQSIIKLIGEFKGDGVYQRLPTAVKAGDEGTIAIENKSGIYSLKQGQTVRDVIIATGGVTPQADLKHARIERNENNTLRIIPVDLESLLVKGDTTADVALVNGDALVLPSLVNKVYVFGEVREPGACTYSPNRRVIDYIGDAGGPTQMAKLSGMSVVSGTAEKPKIVRLDVSKAMRGTSTKDNPILEPGDIVYIPSKFVSGWRDAIQLIFTGLSLNSLLKTP